MVIEEDRINKFLELNTENKLVFLLISGKVIISEFNIEDYINLYNLTIIEMNKKN